MRYRPPAILTAVNAVAEASTIAKTDDGGKDVNDRRRVDTEDRNQTGASAL